MLITWPLAFFDFYMITWHALHAGFSRILHAKEFLLYFTWPLPATLLRVHDLNQFPRAY